MHGFLVHLEVDSSLGNREFFIQLHSIFPDDCTVVVVVNYHSDRKSLHCECTLSLLGHNWDTGVLSRGKKGCALLIVLFLEIRG